jgi:hypothetical protein
MRRKNPHLQKNTLQKVQTNLQQPSAAMRGRRGKSAMNEQHEQHSHSHDEHSHGECKHDTEQHTNVSRPPFFLTHFGTFVALVVLFGLGVCWPGVLMRLEHVPEPRPFITVNMCKTSTGDYIGMSQACGDSVVNAEEQALLDQSISLHHHMIVSDVTYIPVLLVPDRTRM